MNEWYSIPTYYVKPNSSDVIRNIKQYLKNPIGATLSLLTPPAAFEQATTRILRNDLHWTLGNATADTRLILQARWPDSTKPAEAIIEFKLSDTETDILEWDWFPPITVVVGSTGNFSGTIASGIDDNLNNPSGADVAITVSNRSSSIGSATINADNDLSIAVTGLTANINAQVVLKATATIDGVVRTAQQQVDIRLVVNTVDLDGYVTSSEIADFITAGDLPDTSGFITSGQGTGYQWFYYKW